MASKNNLYVRNFAARLDDAGLEMMFDRFGAILSAKVALDSSGKSKGFGFVCFERERDAEDAIRTMNGRVIGGLELYVAHHRSKEDRKRVVQPPPHQQQPHRKPEIKDLEDLDYHLAVALSLSEPHRGVADVDKPPIDTSRCNLYIKNFGKDVTDAGLEAMFRKFGAITSAKVMRSEEGKSKGFGFVCFENERDAQRAIIEMNGKDTGQKKLYVGLAQSKEDRKKLLTSAHQTSPGEKADKDKDDLCCICMEEPSGEVALVPCGHASCCKACAGTVFDEGGSCPMCRAPIQSILTIYK